MWLETPEDRHRTRQNANRKHSTDDGERSETAEVCRCARLRVHSCWDIVHHAWGNPIWPFMPTSSFGCTVFDAGIALWFVAGAPSFRLGIAGARYLSRTFSPPVMPSTWCPIATARIFMISAGVAYFGSTFA